MLRDLRSVRMDDAGLPDAARRLLALAGAGTAGAGSSTTVPHSSLMKRVGEAYLDKRVEAVAIAALVGETALRAPPPLP